MSYESDDESEVQGTHKWNLINSQALTHSGTNHNDRGMLMPFTDTDTIVVDTGMEPKVNYYSKQAIQTANLVKAKLGKFSLRNIHEAIMNGSVRIPETSTRAQILTADEILVMDVEYKQGLYTEKTQSQETEKTDPTSNNISLEMDLIFDENLTMLISLGIPSNYTMILLVKDKSFDACQPAIDKMVSMHEIIGKNVVEIKVDGEGGIVNTKMSDHLLKQAITVTKLGKNNHDPPHLDRKIRTIKDHIRIIRLLTQFACGGIILLSLYFQICNIVNILPTSANTYNQSPYQALLGRGSNLQEVCPHRPLETVLIAKHNHLTNKTSNANVTKAIFLHAKNIHLPKDKREFEYITLDSMEIITRGEGIG